MAIWPEPKAGNMKLYQIVEKLIVSCIKYFKQSQESRFRFLGKDENLLDWLKSTRNRSKIYAKLYCKVKESIN